MAKPVKYKATRTKSGQINVNRTTRKPGVAHKILDKLVGKPKGRK